MGDLLSGVPVQVITGSGLGSIVLLGIWLIMTGRLVPGRLHDEVRADRDAWRAAAEISEKRADVQAAQLTKLIEQGQGLERLMQAIQTAVQQAGGGR